MHTVHIKINIFSSCNILSGEILFYVNLCYIVSDLYYIILFEQTVSIFFFICVKLEILHTHTHTQGEITLKDTQKY